MPAIMRPGRSHFAGAFSFSVKTNTKVSIEDGANQVLLWVVVEVVNLAWKSTALKTVEKDLNLVV